MSLQPAGDSHLTTAEAISAVHNCEFWNRFWDESR
jgi:hypothetical protein